MSSRYLERFFKLDIRGVDLLSIDECVKICKLLKPPSENSLISYGNMQKMMINAIKNTFALLRDFVFLFLIAGNIAWQLFVLYKMYTLRNPLQNQCDNVDNFTYGLLVDVLCMTALLPVTSIVFYSVLGKKADPVGCLLMLFNIAWLLFSGIGAISYFKCRSSTYPLMDAVVVLAVNFIFIVAILIFGRKHGTRSRRYAKPVATIEKVEANEVPRLNKFLSLERSENLDPEVQSEAHYGANENCWDHANNGWNNTDYGHHPCDWTGGNYVYGGRDTVVQDVHYADPYVNYSPYHR